MDCEIAICQAASYALHSVALCTTPGKALQYRGYDKIWKFYERIPKEPQVQASEK